MYASPPFAGEKDLKVDLYSSYQSLLRGLVKCLFETRVHVCDENTIDVLRFEISSEKMNVLLSNHQICAADVRCLDVDSKQCLKTLCLKTCLRSYTDQTLSRET